MNSNLIVKIYQYSAASLAGAFAHAPERFSGDRVSGLTFGTKNPGGFSECSFRIDLSFANAMDMYANYHHYFVRIENSGGDKAWEGRMEDITAEPGQVTILCKGHWANAFDSYYDDGSFSNDPAQENSILALDEYVLMSSTYQILAQSFKLTEARAIKDIQVRLSNFSCNAGVVTVQLAEDNSGNPGTEIASGTVSASSIATGGESSFIGITTDEKLDAATLYWIVVRGDPDYWAGVANIASTDNQGTDDRDYLLDSTQDFLAQGITAGQEVINVTDGNVSVVDGIVLASVGSPSATLSWDDNGFFTGLPLAQDDNTGTEETLTGFNFEQDYINVGHSAVFGGINFVVGTTKQTNVCGIKVYYANDTEWTQLEVTDTTASGGRPFYQDGDITWITPEGWPQDDVDGEVAYWIRIEFTGAVSSPFKIKEIYQGRNDKLTFSSISGGTDDDWDNGDSYTIGTGIAVGIDTDAGYADGSLKYYNGAAWAAYSPGSDMIFYVWAHPRFFYTGGTSTFADEVIGDALDSCHFLDSNTEDFEETGISINPIQFTKQEKPGDVIKSVMAFGSDETIPEPLVFLVLEDGKSVFRTYSSGTVWYIDAHNIPMGQQALSLTSRLADMKTKLAVLYSDKVGSRATTAWVENDDLVDRFGYDREGLFSIAGAEAALVDVVADMAADAHSKPGQSFAIMIEGTVEDNGYARWPAWYVRAGDIIKIRNLLPTGSVYNDDVVDKLSTLYVQETSYDSESQRLTVTPTETTADVLDMILALSGLSGGRVI